MLSMSPGLRAPCNSSWNQGRLRRLPQLLQPPAPERPVPAEVAPEADAALPDLPPPEPRQEGAGPSGGAQVETPDAAHTDGTGMRLPARDWLPGFGRNVLTTSYACRCLAAAARGCRRVLGEPPCGAEGRAGVPERHHHRPGGRPPADGGKPEDLQEHLQGAVRLLHGKAWVMFRL
jgi:hypothetical protein